MWVFVVGAWWLRCDTCGCVVCVGTAGNNIGAAGAQALGPRLATLSNMTKLNLGGACVFVVDICCDSCVDYVCVCFLFFGLFQGTTLARKVPVRWAHT